MSASFGAVLRWYLAVLMGGLFLQGVGSLIFRLTPALAAAAPYVVRGIFGIDYWHAWIHIVWGAVGCVALDVQRTRRAAVGLALIFGLFYTALAFVDGYLMLKFARKGPDGLGMWPKRPDAIPVTAQTV